MEEWKPLMEFHIVTVLRARGWKHGMGQTADTGVRHCDHVRPASHPQDGIQPAKTEKVETLLWFTIYSILTS